MKRFQSILCGSLLTIALAPTAFARTGNITVNSRGNITVNSTGNITVNKTGNITVNSTSNVTPISSTSTGRFSFDLTNYLFMLMPSIW